METPSLTKDISLLAVGVAFGALPWLLDKVGIEVPKPLASFFGVVTVACLAWGISNLVKPLLPQEWDSPKISIPNAIVTLAAILAALWWLSASLGWTHVDLTRFPDKKLDRISGRTYTGGVVEIDGRLFEHCTFRDVTLMYHGTGSYSLLKPTFEGSVYVKTDNKAIHDFMTVREYMGGLVSTLQAFDIDDTGKIHPLNQSNPTNLKWSDEQETFPDKEYSNTTVEIDGKRFERCKFTNVTFLYHGIGPTDFVDCKILESVNLMTDSKATMGLLRLQSLLQTISGKHTLEISGRDAKGATVPLTVTKKP